MSSVPRKRNQTDPTNHRASRREFLALGGAGTLGTALAIGGTLGSSGQSQVGRSQIPGSNGGSPYAGPARAETDSLPSGSAHTGGLGTVADISAEELRIFDPSRYLVSWNFNELTGPQRAQFYQESTLPDGRRLREYLFVGRDREIEIAPGLYFPAWTYNNQVPGPTIRATQGDRIRIWFINEGTHPHTIHFHGWHPFAVDGSLPGQFVQPVQGPGEPFGLQPGADKERLLRQWAEDPARLRKQGYDIYEFDADPVGVHLYHCHSVPLKRHIHKGLYGVFIVDPPGEGPEADRRPKIDPDTNEPLPADHPVRELVMVMNGFDTNFDGENEVYAANTVGFHYMRHPIPVKIGELIRVYLVNVTEFDPINSFHLHAGFFRVYRTGTTLRSDEYTDTVMMCQAERAILEFRFREGWPGKYMFHAHQSEFAELGWMGLFAAEEPASQLARLEQNTPAPEFALVDQHGRLVRLSDYRGRKHVVLVFHLGVGCSFCGDQMRALVQQAGAVRDLDAEILAVSADSPEVNRANQCGGEDSAIRLLSDPDNSTAARYGSYAVATGRQQHGTFVIDKGGHIRWKYVGEQPLMNTRYLTDVLRQLNGYAIAR